MCFLQAVIERLVSGVYRQAEPLLSYRHSFHAGNFADVLKHIVVVEILRHLVQKDKSFHFIDTHAGAGLFDLQSEHAAKLREYTDGVARLETGEWPELAAYFAAIDACNKSGSRQYYPGSPMLARHFLRRQDRAWLYELHSADIALLQSHVGSDRRIKVLHEDGFKGMLALLPPTSRRGFILIDPSYEIKSDFDQVIESVIAAYQKFATGTYAIWYPVVERRRAEQLVASLRSSGIRKIQCFELAVAADTRTVGMTAAGMIVINPPWTLMKTMSELLPRLVAVLAQSEGAFFNCEVLAGD